MAQIKPRVYSAVLFVTLIAPATAQAWEYCSQYDSTREQAICERQNELERRIEDADKQQQKRLEELKRKQEYDMGMAEADAWFYAQQAEARALNATGR